MITEDDIPEEWRGVLTPSQYYEFVSNGTLPESAKPNKPPYHRAGLIHMGGFDFIGRSAFDEALQKFSAEERYNLYHGLFVSNVEEEPPHKPFKSGLGRTYIDGGKLSEESITKLAQALKEWNRKNVFNSIGSETVSKEDESTSPDQESPKHKAE